MDVEKRNKAKEGNLNYIEFWSFKELKEYFIDYFENHCKQVLYYNCKINNK